MWSIDVCPRATQPFPYSPDEQTRALRTDCFYLLFTLLPVGAVRGQDSLAAPVADVEPSLFGVYLGLGGA